MFTKLNKQQKSIFWVQANKNVEWYTRISINNLDYECWCFSCVRCCLIIMKQMYFLFDLHIQIQAEGTFMYVVVRGKHPTAGLLALCVCASKSLLRDESHCHVNALHSRAPTLLFQTPSHSTSIATLAPCSPPPRFSPSLQPGVSQTLPLKSKSYSSTPGL